MSNLTKKNIENEKERLESIIESLNLKDKKKNLKLLEEATSKTDFWNDNKKASSIMKQIENIRREIETSENLLKDIDTLLELWEITNEKVSLQEEFESIQKKINDFERVKFLSGRYDNRNVIMSIYAGQGGTEANDWTSMLLRMYQMYFDKKGWKHNIEEVESGSETGISSVTLKIEGDYVYGLLKKEHGTHRLVRVSPFNAQGLRQTTFAGVEVIPILESIDTDINIEENDIEFKAVRSSGPGGQSVNKTSSAVQITHIPTGITVHSSSHKSQHQNKENALALLKSKLVKILEEERIEKIQEIKGDYKKASWGNQIRNYILHPYKLVKDLRTNLENHDPHYILDGNLDDFIEAQLRIE